MSKPSGVGLGFGLPDSFGLLERDRELEVLAGAVQQAAQGRGCVVVLEGAAGVGKTALLDAVAGHAAACGLSVLRARGDELLAPVAWSVALELLGPVLGGAAAGENDRLLAGPGAPARTLFSAAAADGEPHTGHPSQVAAVAGALAWVACALTESGAVALLVDDAHWADEPSLRFLSLAANRAADAGIVVLIARRRSDRDAAAGRVLDDLSSRPGSVLLELAPLSVEASTVLVRKGLGDQAGDELARACAQATGGNPFYLTQLVAELAGQAVRGQAVEAARVRTLTPASVSRAVLVRLARLGPDALALSEAVAVLGDRCAFISAAQLARLERGCAEVALDALVGVEILRPVEPLGFVHPLVASSVYAEIALARRGELHARAARLLSDAGTDPQLVAAQLLAAGGRGDRWVVEALRAAATTALRRGAATTAADYLQRALGEPPAADQRAEVLVELARAEAAAGRPEAAERFETLLELVHQGAERSQIHLELGQALSAHGRHADALAAFERGLAEQQPTLDDARRELRAAYWMTKTMTAQSSAAELEQLERLIATELDDPNPQERALLAAVAAGHALSCQPREQVTELARRAWGDGALLAAETSDGLHWTLITGALMHADELEFELAICEQALIDARRRGSRMAFATASYIRGGARALLGRNDDAIADLEIAVAAHQDGWSQYLGTALGTLCRTRLERDDISGAREALRLAEQDTSLADSIEQTVVLIGHGQVLLREGRPAEALEPFQTAGRILSEMSEYVAWAPWRPGAVRALVALERRDQAHQLATEMVELTRRLGAPSHLALALRTLAHTERGTRALELLEEAVSLFDQHPQRLQHAYALVEYGAALRRAGHRAAAGDRLRHGLGLAERGGLKALATHAIVELAAAGTRTRPHTLTGIESLTPTERRVAALAAQDLSNREIAQQLFVTLKTVEYHLANTYRKLGVRGRAGIATALARTDPARTATEHAT